MVLCGFVLRASSGKPKYPKTLNPKFPQSGQEWLQPWFLEEVQRFRESQEEPNAGSSEFCGSTIHPCLYVHMHTSIPYIHTYATRACVGGFEGACRGFGV